MKIIDQISGLDPEAKVELQDACDRLANGMRTPPEQKRDAIANLNQMREEIRKRIGVQNLAVNLVRQSRDSQ